MLKKKKKSQAEIEAKLETFEKDSIEENVSEGSFMNPKKGRGRPKGSKNAEKVASPTSPVGAPEMPGAEVEKVKTYIRPVVGLLGKYGVKIAEDTRADFTANEALIITDAAANCINAYLPSLLGKHTDLIVLSASLGQWGIRVYMLRQENLTRMLAEKKQRDEAKAQYQASQGVPVFEQSEINH